MNISLESYRHRIGCFHTCRTVRRLPNIRRIPHPLSLGVLIFILLPCTTLFLPPASAPSLPSLKRSLARSVKVPLSRLPSPTPCLPPPTWSPSPPPPFGVSWSAVNAANKLAHALIGNKRNLGYKYLAWNCGRGFLSEQKIDDVKVTISRHKPHVIGVSEVDLIRCDHNNDDSATNNFTTEQLLEKLQIRDYNIHLPQSWYTSGFARIIVYVRDDLQATALHPQDPSFNHVQNLTLEIGFGKSKKHYFNFYYREWTSSLTGRRDKQSQQSDLNLLLDIWRNCTAGDRDFLALGDMNLCAKKWNETDFEHKDLANSVSDFMNEENCSQVVNEFTRVQSVGGIIQRSCLDHATVNCVDKISPPLIIAVGKSDHLGVLLNKSSKEVRGSARTNRKRIYKLFDKEAFIHDIEEAKNAGNFDRILTTECPDEAFEVFEKTFCRILDVHAPLKVVQNRTNYVPYLDANIKEAMKDRDTLKKIAIKEGNIEDFEKYKRKRNEVSKLQKVAKTNYYRSKFEEEGSSKSIWRTSYEILGNHRSSFPAQILHAGKLMTKPLEIATEINKFFITKIKKLKDDFEPVDNQDPLTELKTFLKKKNVPREGFHLRELNTEDTKKLLKSLKGKKSSGLDWICGYSLKIASATLVEELRALINLSIREGKFVDSWKCAKVLPAWKNKGTRFELKHYRPLSNLSEVSKLAEIAVHGQMIDYLENNNLIHPNHHGFLSHHSTATALQHLLDIWLKHLDQGKLCAATFLDLSAGFDVIDHHLLLLKMNEYNFSDNTIKWFNSYLLDRTQCVQVESSLSPALPVPWGVPQGSILGPTLFLLFINELPDIVTNDIADLNDAMEGGDGEENMNNIIIYADDNTPTTADKDPLVLQTKAQKEVDLVTDWFEKNNMICSSEKTKLLIIGTQANRRVKLTNNNLTLRINVCGEVKVESNSERLLGVLINNVATFRDHFHGNGDNNIGLVKQLSTRVNMLKRLKRHMSPTRLRLVMEGLFSSKLIYGMTVWGRVWGIPGSHDEEARASPTMTKDDLRKLQVLQNKCLRLLTDSDYSTPTAALLNNTCSLSVHQRIAQLTLAQVYTIFNKRKPDYHYDRLFGHEHLTDDQPNTRASSQANSARINFKLSLARSGFFYQSSRLWTALPDVIKLEKSKTNFKKKCKAWIKTAIAIKP